MLQQVQLNTDNVSMAGRIPMLSADLQHWRKS